MNGKLALVVLLSSLALGACGSQTPDPAAYRDRTEQAVSTALSEVATVQLVIERLDRHDLQSSYAGIVVTDSDDALGGAVTSYTSLDPPRAEQHLFEQVSAQLGAAQDLVLRARIAVSRNDATQYPALARDLSHVAEQLDQRDKALR